MPIPFSGGNATVGAVAPAAVLSGGASGIGLALAVSVLVGVTLLTDAGVASGLVVPLYNPPAVAGALIGTLSVPSISGALSSPPTITGTVG